MPARLEAGADTCLACAPGAGPDACTLVAQRDELERRVREKTAAIELQARGMELTMEGMAVLRGDTYVWMNAAHAQMYGWRADELNGRTWRELYTPSVQAWIEAEAFPRLARDGRWHGEVTGLRRDGRAVDIELSLTMSDDTLVCCCRDISLRKAGERRLAESMRELDRANARLQEANRLKDEFLACISHELRTPLHSVVGIAELISEELAGPITARQRGLLEQVLSSGRHLEGLINDLLDVSRIESGAMALVREPVSLQYIVDVAMETVNRMAQEAGVGLNRPAALTTLQVVVDERRLVQVLVNLLTNAVKFTPPGGAVTVDIEESPTHLAVAVHDTGIGIAIENQLHLFDAFRQVDSSLTRQRGGTGLGLYMVKRLTELHGGHVSVDSAPGKGSCFRVQFPKSAVSTGALAVFSGPCSPPASLS
ncbi:MAG: ATP-binding protein [Vicinamibacterales bacterium]